MPVQRYVDPIRSERTDPWNCLAPSRPISPPARAPQDGDVLAAAFAPDAIVHDEGHSHRGPQAIRAWWLAAKVRYRHHAEPIDVTGTAGKTVVRATVTGDFPGSPAVLTFTFGLAGDHIADLEIG